MKKEKKKKRWEGRERERNVARWTVKIKSAREDDDDDDDGGETEDEKEEACLLVYYCLLQWDLRLARRRGRRQIFFFFFLHVQRSGYRAGERIKGGSVRGNFILHECSVPVVASLPEEIHKFENDTTRENIKSRHFKVLCCASFFFFI